ncbi:hypothetical protein TNCV_3854631 [Trichonephila clavipes]|nr:hypothetical protein TNCV_3854631 [Trichonephila clavipes]
MSYFVALLRNDVSLITDSEDDVVAERLGFRNFPATAINEVWFRLEESRNGLPNKRDVIGPVEINSSKYYELIKYPDNPFCLGLFENCKLMSKTEPRTNSAVACISLHIPNENALPLSKKYFMVLLNRFESEQETEVRSGDMCKII